MIYSSNLFVPVSNAYPSIHSDSLHTIAAIASNLALGYGMADAVERACRYVEIGIRTAPDLGKGSGPINHFHAMEVTEYSESSLKREDWTSRLKKP